MSAPVGDSLLRVAICAFWEAGSLRQKDDTGGDGIAPGLDRKWIAPRSPDTDNRRSGRSVRKHLIGDDRKNNANPDVSAGANAIKIARNATAPIHHAIGSLIKSQYLDRQQAIRS